MTTVSFTPALRSQSAGEGTSTNALMQSSLALARHWSWRGAPPSQLLPPLTLPTTFSFFLVLLF